MVLDGVRDSARNDAVFRPKRVGVLGGGQLGRMLLAPAARLGLEMHMLDPDPNCPCAGYVGHAVQGDFRDHDAVVAFGQGLDVITIEIEDVSVSGLEALAAQGVRVHPSPSIIAEIQDKGLQKQLFARLEIPTAPFTLVDDAESTLAVATDERGFVQKLRRGGYDGKGVKVCDAGTAAEALFDAPCVVESRIDIEKELAVIVARTAEGEISCFPPVEMVFDPDLNLVDFLLAPARVDASVIADAEAYAHKIATELELVGLLAIELFLTRDGELLVNEMAPRPHNSGHHTIEANLTSQYEQLLRAICGLPLGRTDARCMAGMLNLIGANQKTGAPVYTGIPEALRQSGVYPHIYGKAETRPGRKMGHITFIADSEAELLKKYSQLKTLCEVSA